MLSTLLLAALWVVAGAQISIAPSERISRAKEEGQLFSSYRFFSSAAHLRSETLPSDCADCAVLQLNIQEVKQLQRTKPQLLSFNLPTTLRSSGLEVELVRADVLADGFAAYAASAAGPLEFDEALFYRGTLQSDPNALVTLTVYGDEMRAMVSSPEMGNLALGRYGRQGTTYVLAPDEADERPFDCATEDTGRAYAQSELSEQAGLRSLDNCINMYIEVDYDIYQDKGSSNAVMQYVTGFFNEVATLYANEQIKVKLSEVFIWDTPSPYQGSDSYTLLQQFQSTRKSFNGDLAQLISYQASGGIAYVNGLCSFSDSYKLSFVSVSPSYKTVPTYSYTVMASAHEFGHLFGSQHTHACAWNGNGTAIDGCPGYTEGSCAVPGSPANGGTIMSYCHITRVGINLSNGFGQQPGNLMRNAVSNANCLQVCSTPPPSGGGGGGDSSGGGNSGGGCQTITMELTLDLFGSETTWELKDANGSIVGSGGPYEDKQEGVVISETFCLPTGCYTYSIFDSRSDGLCCGYGNGSLTLTSETGEELFAATAFGSSSSGDFCIDTGGDGNDANDDCAPIDFTANQVISYGGTQDRGNVDVTDNGTGLYLERNAWKAIAIDYEITANTRMIFEFKSNRIGEIHGIGFDNDNRISSSQTFQLYGTQRWGISDFNNYPGNGQWVTYEIPVGDFLRGPASRLFFVADHDVGSPVGTSYFRNVKLFEGNGCTAGIVAEGGEAPATSRTLTATPHVDVFPNPAASRLSMRILNIPQGEQDLHVFNLMGQRLLQRKINIQGQQEQIQLDISNLPPGTYMYRLGHADSGFSGKFSVNR